jgi:hypothetical protein
MEWKCERGRKKGKVERFLDKKTGAASMLNQKSLSLSLSLGDYTKTKILLSILVKTETFPILFGIVSFFLSL